MTPTKKRVRQVHTLPYMLGLRWTIKVDGKVLGRTNTQADAERIAVFVAKLLPAASVKFHDRRGRISEERTFPAASDPKKTPG